MPYKPQNVSGTIVVAIPTTQLRWVSGNSHRFPELQQAWKVLSTGQLEWRSIPLINQ